VFSHLFSIRYILYITFVFFAVYGPVTYIQSTQSIEPGFAQESASYYTESNESNQTLVFFFSILFVISIALVVRKLIKKPKKRRSFPLEVKKQVLRDQDHKCAICRRNKGTWDYDHIDGNRTNNDVSNCQALCPDCHAKKTRGLIKIKSRSNTKKRIKMILLLFIILVIMYLFLSR
jgi:multisubunit Na+/H+ antiporter MnhB subunit